MLIWLKNRRKGRYRTFQLRPPRPDKLYNDSVGFSDDGYASYVCFSNREELGYQRRSNGGDNFDSDDPLSRRSTVDLGKRLIVDEPKQKALGLGRKSVFKHLPLQPSRNDHIPMYRRSPRLSCLVPAWMQKARAELRALRVKAGLVNALSGAELRRARNQPRA